MSEFWVGVLVLPAILAAFGALWALWLLINLLNNKVNELLVTKIEVKPYGKNPFREGPHDPYEQSAERLKQAVKRSPKLYMFHALGWRVFVVRDYDTSVDS